ncbi:MAG: tRNA (N(6)-L-threonylcarbamoyladenosine(37)-C(2))-methylthiotransferase MtaB [bacterium]|nr:tRNA (N(6)-L-threonylcarbamoyladenosine(37)-C(2))-methylthiotransferase MtaB [bacterium]
MNKRVAFYTLGCKVNSSDTDVLASSFALRGYEVVDFNNESDIYLINTCTVTHQADAQCRQIIRQVKKKQPDAVIAVIGCYAQADPGEISAIPGVDIILGTREKYSIFDHLEGNSCVSGPVIRNGMDIDPFLQEDKLPFSTSRTRAFLKIQDGCSYKCSYCIIPSVRGSNISRKRGSIIDKAKEIRDSGYKEIVLTAVNLGEYSDKKDYRLTDLLKDLTKIEDIPRIRLTSIEPNCLSVDLIRLISESNVICRHFHVPLQSGSDSVLKRMRRKYLTKHYSEVVRDIRKYLPEAGIGADVMTGFPGETDEEFNETYNYIKDLPATYLHVFRYSPRKGTEAALLSEQVDPKKSKSRSKKLIELGLKKKIGFISDQIGKTAEVLFESTQSEPGIFEGFTENYIRVICKAENVANQIKKVHLKERTGAILRGEILD